MLTPERRSLFTSWISRCMEKHTFCKSSIVNSLPRRLLNVGFAKDPALFLDESPRPGSRYITLSHCWKVSLADNIKTTRQNIAERKSSTPWEGLPKTIQDAIIITRWLGVKYLWIDSLCMVQDDPKDRDEEIARMGDIYAGSLVALASHFDPAESGSAADGMFLEQKHVREVVQLDDEGNQFSTYTIDQTYHNIIMPESLTSRAWCLQERLLSPRILHFRRGEVIFECFSSSSCECKPDGIPKHTDRDLPVEVWNKNRHINTTLKSDMGKELLHRNQDKCWDYWHRVVAAYTSADLTRAEDALPALSGIAHRMPTEIFGTYVAGLWTNNLPYELLWQHDDSYGRERARRTPFVAPSFSWACVSGTSKFDYQWYDAKEIRVAEVLQAQTTLATRDPMGAITSGFIRLKARRKLVKPSHGYGISSHDGHWDSFRSSVVYDGWWIYPSLDTEDDEDDHAGQEVYAVEIIARRRTLNWNDGGEAFNSRTDALLVKQSNKDGQAHERIGLAFIYCHSPSRDFFDGQEAEKLTLI